MQKLLIVWTCYLLVISLYTRLIGTIDYKFNVQYSIQNTVYCTLKCIVQCTLYLTLYSTQTPISGIDKYTVYLTEHSSVNLPKYSSVLKIKLGVQ